MTLVIIAIAAPAIAALIGFLAGRRWTRTVVPLAVGGAGVALVATAVLAMRAIGASLTPETLQLAHIPTGAVPPIGVNLRLDGLAALVSLAVGVVAFAVQVYSTSYLKGDARYSSYAAFVSLFTSAMLLVVFADDLIVLLVGWEVMGVCSYFLIGHYWEQEVARGAAVKAFVVTRLGDVGFLFGIFALAIGFGTFEIGAITEAAAGANGRVSNPGVIAEALPDYVATVATLLLLCGVVGKSAQFPLHTWLPDAMAGPTPISALIHAATMVAAGIYLVARLYDVFLLAPATLAVMAVIAAITMLGAALAALAQDDIKRVLAYSTVSQLAFMLAGLAVGSYAAATFHLLTHAAFKALLFLAAGSVIHALGTNFLRDIGGLRKAMPITFVTMTIGLAALAGVPPFAGFFSKEAIIGATEHAARHDGPVAQWAAWLVLVVALATIAVTAAYVMRTWLMTFFGRARSDVAAHESPRAMSWPLVALAIPAALLGFIGLREQWLAQWLAIPLPIESRLDTAVREEVALAPDPVTAALPVLLVALGAAAMLFAWRRDPAADPVERLRRIRPVLARAFYVDELYDRMFVRPVRQLVRGVGWTDDRVVIAGVAGSGRTAGWLGALLQRTQAGRVPGYLTGLLLGVVLIAVGVVTFA